MSYLVTLVLVVCLTGPIFKGIVIAFFVGILLVHRLRLTLSEFSIAMLFIWIPALILEGAYALILWII